MPAGSRRMLIVKQPIFSNDAVVGYVRIQHYWSILEAGISTEEYWKPIQLSLTGILSIMNVFSMIK